jgi:hypothetical protein
MELDPGDKLRPSSESSPQPSNHSRTGTPSPSFLSLTAGPTCHHQSPAVSLAGDQARAVTPSPLFNSREYPDVSISICAYKSPQMSSVDSLSFSCSRRRRIDGIDRRTPQSLRASPVKSANDGEPRAPSSLLTSLPRPGAPP